MNTIRSFLKFFDNQAFKIHFYSIQRRSLLYSKKLLDVQDEVEFVDEQLAENQEAIKETHEEIHEEAIQETHEGAIEETHEEEQEEADDGINETDKPNEQKDTEHTEFFLNIPSGDFRMKFERSFDKMKAELKWYLPNGKCVEDELFALCNVRKSTLVIPSSWIRLIQSIRNIKCSMMMNCGKSGRLERRSCLPCLPNYVTI